MTSDHKATRQDLMAGIDDRDQWIRHLERQNELLLICVERLEERIKTLRSELLEIVKESAG